MTKLRIVTPKREGPSFELMRRAVRLFRSEFAPRSVRRHNARQWLASTQWLGDRWVLRGGQVSWGTSAKVGK